MYFNNRQFILKTFESFDSVAHLQGVLRENVSGVEEDFPTCNYFKSKNQNKKKILAL